MSTTRTTARHEIRRTAENNSWAVESSSNWHDRFIRGTDLPEGSTLEKAREEEER